MDRPNLRDPVNDVLFVVLLAVCLYILFRALV